MKPIYLEITAKLEALRRGATEPIQLPDEHTLAAKYSVARQTLRRALRSLEVQGIVTRTPRVGTFLQPELPHSGSLEGKVIGIVFPWWTNISNSWYVSVICGGVSNWAKEHDCRIHVLQMDEIPLKSRDGEWLETIRKNDIAGVIWVQPQEPYLRLLELTAAYLPTVSVGRPIKNDQLYQVTPDFDQAAQLVDSFLLQAGHSQYAIVGKNAFNPVTTMWLESFKRAQAMRDAEFNPRAHFIDHGCYSEKMLGKLLLELYNPSHPEVKAFFFVSSGSLNSALSDKLLRQRFEEDLSAITMNLGYGPYSIEHIWPRHLVAHIDCDWTQVAEHATNMLSLITEGKRVPRLIREPVTLVQGGKNH